MQPSRLFHAIVIVGCAMSPLGGCGSTEESPCEASDAGVDGGDAGDAGATSPHGLCKHQGEGWPTTK